MQVEILRRQPIPSHRLCINRELASILSCLSGYCSELGRYHDALSILQGNCQTETRPLPPSSPVLSRCKQSVDPPQRNRRKLMRAAYKAKTVQATNTYSILGSVHI